jgi:1-acyl-sn-glycerol-3-phosphate acyltransferase
VFYGFLRQLATLVLKVFYSKIYLNGEENVPEKGPLIIAANHPMAFGDACILACFINRPLHFLVRGDVFRKGWRWFFRWTNQIPIYRFRDGFSNLRKNHLSFIKVQEALADRKAVLIFCEGNTKLQKRLQKVQRGTARLVFGAFEEKGVEDIAVLPVGLNYTAGGRFRSELMIEIGTPLKQQDYMDEYKSKKSIGIRNITRDLHSALMPLVIHFEDANDDIWMDGWLEFQRNLNRMTRFPVMEKNKDQFRIEKHWVEKINNLEEQTRRRLGKMIAEWLQGNANISVRSGNFIKRTILIAASPVALMGWLLNFLPFYIAKWIANSKVGKIEFRYPVRMGIFLVLGLIYYIIVTVILTILYWPGILALIIIPALGYFSIIWLEEWRKLAGRISFAPTELKS